MTTHEKIECRICKGACHSIQLHLRDNHPELTLADYQEQFPDAPILSTLAQERLEASIAARAKEALADPVMMAGTVLAMPRRGAVVKKNLHEVFELGRAKAALNKQGNPIPISVIDAHDFEEYVPAIDPGYVFDINILKDLMLGLELNTPIYVWGHAGTGKTSIERQICARTNRPWIRVQHTVNTEESHILGQWTVKGGETVWEDGPLPFAMKHGLVYVADEYDFGLPSVLSVYQAVLEGEPLVIKEAPAGSRIVKPHPNFRFMATGNTNGSGDETGLYLGTSIQNAANYDRYGVVVEMPYMPKKQEVKILQNQAGINEEDAGKLVDFAALVREAFASGKISATVSPRALITGAKLGVRKGSWREGLALCFINKLSSIDREVVGGLAQRVFG